MNLQYNKQRYRKTRMQAYPWQISFVIESLLGLSASRWTGMLGADAQTCRAHILCAALPKREFKIICIQQHLKFFQPVYDVNGFIVGHLRTVIRAYASFPGVIYSCASNYTVYLDNSATSEGSGVPLASV